MGGPHPAFSLPSPRQPALPPPIHKASGVPKGGVGEAGSPWEGGVLGLGGAGSRQEGRAEMKGLAINTK